MEKHGFRGLIERNFNAVMLVGLLCGLFMPGLEHTPTWAALVFIAVVIFLSCNALSLNDFKKIRIKDALYFYGLRFVALPIGVYYAVMPFLPDYAMGLFLIALMPTGIAAAAIAKVIGANSTLGLSATVVTNGLVPITIPLMVLLVGGDHIVIDQVSLFKSLFLTVIIPPLIYFLMARRIPGLKATIEREGQWLTFVLIGAMCASVAALRREFFFDNGEAAIVAIVLGIILFIGFYVFGWFYGHVRKNDESWSYAVASGVNNIGLSAAIAILYFSPMTVLVTILGQVPWIVVVALFKKCADKAAQR